MTKSHSPIILSDIPKQNTIFLTRDKDNNIIVSDDNKETFAANIFSLYQNAFFMDESGIGAFAENRLCELVDKIHRLLDSGNDYEKLKDEIVRMIGLIGDPYIRHKFALEFEDELSRLPVSRLDKEIEETEARLEMLKKQRDLGGQNAEN